MSLRSVRPNIVQSIRAFLPHTLQVDAAQMNQHFLYANLGAAQAKQDVLDILAAQYGLPEIYVKGLDTLYEGLTDVLHKAGPQPGFIAVLEQIPANAKFDKEAREQLLDVFREVADYWADRKVAFRCFYSFAVARVPEQGAQALAQEEGAEPMPTDRLTDISPLALRMSSPFNAGYWLAAA